MSREDSQVWLDQHAVEYVLGKLTAEDEVLFRQLAVDDPEFAALIEASVAGRTAHVPAAMIARWDAAGRRLRGIERDLVLEHLRSCDECREDLKLVGIELDPELALIVPGPRRRWTPWFGGALIGVAATFALMLPQLRTPTIDGFEIPVISPQLVRGNDAPALQVGQDVAAILVAVALPSGPAPGSETVLRVFDPTGHMLTETRLAPPPWSPPATQIVILGDPGFAEGDYRVELHVFGEPEARDLGRFRIELE